MLALSCVMKIACFRVPNDTGKAALILCSQLPRHAQARISSRPGIGTFSRQLYAYIIRPGLLNGLCPAGRPTSVDYMTLNLGNGALSSCPGGVIEAGRADEIIRIHGVLMMVMSGC